MSAPATDTDVVDSRLGPVRLAIGLAQGLVLLGLHRSWDAKVWPATLPDVYWALVLFAGVWPLVLLGGLGGLRRRTLALWAAVAAALVLGVGFYDIARQAAGPAPTLSPQAVLAVVIALFVGHHLVAAGDGARRWIGPYTAYYDAAWKDGVQLGLSALFVGVFWALLGLGAALFKLIGLNAFGDIIGKDWLAYPATAVAFAAAVHLTDLRAGLTRGVRTIALALLSWLMPLMVLIAAGFLIALPFTGLEPLWRTRAAANVLLSAAAALIVLVNAAYHDGAPERRPPLVLRWAGRAAGLLVAPMVAIAAYGVAVRVGQHGWTPQRIIASACALVGACYATGYIVAALLPGPWMKPLERTNILTAFVIMAVIVALFTPIADPARISVADQVQRLQAGHVSPEKFDFKFLKFGGARFGIDALHRLQALRTGPNAADIARRASEALSLTSPWDQPAPKPVALADRLKVYPARASIPASFLDQAKNNDLGGHSACLTRASDGPICDAYVVDIYGAGDKDVLLVAPADRSDHYLAAEIFRRRPDGAWAKSGELVVTCASSIQALRRGEFKFAPPKARDVILDGRQFNLLSDPAYGCPELGGKLPDRPK